MAIRTVSNLGGDFTSSSTWVGGIIPSGLDSVAFTLTSGPLNILSSVTLLGFDLRNYTNTLTLKDCMINITLGGSNTFINLGTGGYTIVTLDSSNSVVSNTQSLSGFNIICNGGNCTITSNGTPWNCYLYTDVLSGSIVLSDNFTQNGKWSSEWGCPLLNNRIIFNGDPIYDLTPGLETFQNIQFSQSTSIIEINSPALYNNIYFGDCLRVEINSPIVDFTLSGNFAFSNTMDAVCIFTTPIIYGYIEFSGSLASTTFTCNDIVGDLSITNDTLIITMNNIIGDVVSTAGIISTITLNNATSNVFAFYMESASSVGTINLNANVINSTSNINSVYINSTFNCNVSTFNSPNLTLSFLNLNFLIMPIFNISTLISLRQYSTNLFDITLPQLNLSGNLVINSPNTDILLTNITASTVAVTSTSQSNIDMGNGNINICSILSPTSYINLNNININTFINITSTSQSTVIGGTTSSIGEIRNGATTPLLILNNAVNLNTNLTTYNLNSIIQLDSPININILSGSSNLMNLTLTGSFGLTANTIQRLQSLTLTPGNYYSIKDSAYLSNCLISSGLPGTQASLNLGYSSQSFDNYFVNVSATDINSNNTHGGVHTYYGTIINSSNWRTFDSNSLPQISSTF